MKQMIYKAQYNSLFAEPEVEEPNEHAARYNIYPSSMEGCESDFLIGLYSHDSKVYNHWLSSRIEIVGEHKWVDGQRVVDGVDYRIAWCGNGSMKKNIVAKEVAIPITKEIMKEEKNNVPSMKKRYRCVVKYPGGNWEKGEIITDEEFMFYNQKESITNYPDCFKELFWWEERDFDVLEEIKYVKTHGGNSVRTVKEFQLRWEKIVLDGGKVRPIKHWIPATQQEYETYLLTKEHQSK